MISVKDLPVPELLWYSCDGMMVIDEKRRILAMNPTLERFTGQVAADLIGMSECGVLLSCRDMHGCPLANRPDECPGLKAMTRFETIRSSEYTIRDWKGRGIVMNASYTPIQLPGRPIWALVVMRDITAQKRRERRLAMQAMSDSLTGLPNRAAFFQAAGRELKLASRHSRPLSIAMVDLDRYKPYNDIYGHQAGDKLLRAVASVLQAGRRGSDMAARYGGDEFLLLLPETDEAGAVAVSERIRSTVAQFPFVILESPGAIRAETPVTVSIGVACFPGDGDTVEKMLAAADKRMYQAKQCGRNQVVGPS